MLNKVRIARFNFLIFALTASFAVFSAETPKTEAENIAQALPGAKEAMIPLSPDSPTSVIKKYEAEVKDTVAKYRDKNDKETVRKKNDEILSKVRQFFDIYELGRLSLGDHWDKIKKSEQDEYSDVFRQLIERSYISKSDKLIGDYEVKYLNEKIESAKAEVKSAVVQEDADVDILYKMHMKDKRWMIYNILADNTDLVKNYLSQFNSIIGKEGFEGLMKRMKSKLKDSGEE